MPGQYCRNNHEGKPYAAWIDSTVRIDIRENTGMLGDSGGEGVGRG